MPYRMQVMCDYCESVYTTIKKYDPIPPARCKFCGSSMMRILNIWRVK